MMDECEVCGAAKCECPEPVGECCECKTALYLGDFWATDWEGDVWCRECWPGRKEVV